MKTASRMIIFILIATLFGCGNLRESEDAMLQRCQEITEENIFWNVMNGADPSTFPNTPGKNMGMIALLLIHPLPELERHVVLTLRYDAFQNFTGKSGFFLTKNESNEIIKTLIESESPSKRISAFQKMLNADRQASDFLAARLEDKNRINAFLRGEKIPLVSEPRICKVLNKNPN